MESRFGFLAIALAGLFGGAALLWMWLKGIMGNKYTAEQYGGSTVLVVGLVLFLMGVVSTLILFLPPE